MDDEEKIELILNWAEDHPEFDSTFVEDVSETYEEKGVLTDRQSEALDNIIAEFHIE